VEKIEVPRDRFTGSLRNVIKWAVRGLAILMTFVIVMGVADVVWVLYQKLMQPPFMLLQISDILATFGAFMAVLIAIEIFINIIIYLREDVIHVKIVMATALMAIARKVIILDLKELTPMYLLGLASVALAISIGYWLVVFGPGETRRTHSDESKGVAHQNNDNGSKMFSTD
jgi:uncharacterized membrane protein (DUF373 family)